MTTRRNIYEQIAAERGAQDSEWGGPSHDDGHVGPEWLDNIERHWEKAHAALDDGRFSDYRFQMVRIAALSVAAAESYDRRFDSALLASAASGLTMTAPRSARFAAVGIPIQDDIE